MGWENPLFHPQHSTQMVSVRSYIIHLFHHTDVFSEIYIIPVTVSDTNTFSDFFRAIQGHQKSAKVPTKNNFCMHTICRLFCFESIMGMSSESSSVCRVGDRIPYLEGGYERRRDGDEKFVAF